MDLDWFDPVRLVQFRLFGSAKTFTMLGPKSRPFQNFITKGKQKSTGPSCPTALALAGYHADGWRDRVNGSLLHQLVVELEAASPWPSAASPIASHGCQHSHNKENKSLGLGGGWEEPPSSPVLPVSISLLEK